MDALIFIYTIICPTVFTKDWSCSHYTGLRVLIYKARGMNFNGVPLFPCPSLLMMLPLYSKSPLSKIEYNPANFPKHKMLKITSFPKPTNYGEYLPKIQYSVLPSRASDVSDF